MNNKLKIILILILILIGVVIRGEELKGDGVINYRVPNGSTLEISILTGDISIKTWNSNELILSSSTYDDQLPFTVKQEGNKYIVVNKRNSYFAGSVDLNIKLPHKMNLKINSTSSDIEIRGTLEADLKISISAGDILTDNITGDVSIKTTGGDIRMGNLKGKVEINTYGGDIRLGGVVSDRLIKIETAGGDIKIGKVDGESKINTFGGTITLDEVKKNGNISTNGGDIILNKLDGQYKIKTFGGDIKLEEGKGSVYVETGGGSIKLKKVEGKVNAKTQAGDIYFSLNPSSGGESYAKTSSGDIYLHLPANESAIVDVKVMGNYTFDENDRLVETDFNGYLEKKDKQGAYYFYTYNINGGRNKIYLETNNGTVSIKKSKR